MSVHFLQASRMGRLTTVLGPDVLVLQRFNGTERLNDLFDWDVDCLAAQPDIGFAALIGTHAYTSYSYGTSSEAGDGDAC